MDNLGLLSLAALSPILVVAVLLVGLRWPAESLQPFFLPDFIFIVACLVTYGLHRMSGRDIGRAWRVSAGQLAGAAVALLFALPLVRILINSGPDFNSTGLSSMPVTLAEGASAIAGTAWPIFAPWIGALGAFVAGSNTVSNLTFSLFQFATAENIGASQETLVATQAVGGAAGNMVTVHNVVAAAATVGLLGREGDLIRKTIFPTAYYCLCAGGLSFVVINGVGLNAGTGLLVVLAIGLAFVAVRLARQPASDLLVTPAPDAVRSRAD